MRNVALEQSMVDRQLTQAELAELVNVEIHRLTGGEGRVCDRTVRQWVTAKVKWPHERQRRALEAVFGRGAVELGFIPKTRQVPSSEASHVEEGPLLRRAFITAAAAASATVTTPTAYYRVGSSDIERLNGRFATLIAADHRHGGHLAAENSALAMADEAIALQERGTASQRIRNSLYGCAAAFTSSAMWAAIDGRRFEAAQQYLDRASSLAAMSGDQAIQFRIWSHAGTLFRHLHRPADALSANDVARRTAIARRDPLFASLGHARHAAILGLTGDKAAVQRTLDRAQRALSLADPDPARPVWLTAFYNQAELESLSVAAYAALGQDDRAEAHAYRSLRLLRPHMHRTQAIILARLSLAQLRQHDIEPAIATAMSIPRETAVRHVRVAGMLHRLGRTLHTVAPGSNESRAWDAYVHDTLRNGT